MWAKVSLSQATDRITIQNATGEPFIYNVILFYIIKIQISTFVLKIFIAAVALVVAISIDAAPVIQRSKVYKTFRMLRI